jgi:hypothetical protein
MSIQYARKVSIAIAVTDTLGKDGDTWKEVRSSGGIEEGLKLGVVCRYGFGALPWVSYSIISAWGGGFLYVALDLVRVFVGAMAFSVRELFWYTEPPMDLPVV